MPTIGGVGGKKQTHDDRCFRGSLQVERIVSKTSKTRKSWMTKVYNLWRERKNTRAYVRRLSSSFCFIFKTKLNHLGTAVLIISIRNKKKKKKYLRRFEPKLSDAQIELFYFIGLEI